MQSDDIMPESCRTLSLTALYSPPYDSPYDSPITCPIHARRQGRTGPRTRTWPTPSRGRRRTSSPPRSPPSPRASEPGRHRHIWPWLTPSMVLGRYWVVIVSLLGRCWAAVGSSADPGSPRPPRATVIASSTVSLIYRVCDSPGWVGLGLVGHAGLTSVVPSLASHRHMEPHVESDTATSMSTSPQKNTKKSRAPTVLLLRSFYTPFFAYIDQK